MTEKSNTSKKILWIKFAIGMVIGASLYLIIKLLF